jgi:hypothetical protein
MMRPERTTVLIAASLAAALGACGEQAQRPTKPPVAFNPGPAQPPNTQPPSYVGRWAATAELCDDGAWVFTDRSLATAGEVSCTFADVTANETGWIAEGACIAQAPAAPASLVLNTTRAGPNRTLAVSGGPFSGPQVLIACPLKPTGRLAEAAAIDDHITAEAGVADSAVKPYEFKYKLMIGKAWRQDDQVLKLAEPLNADVGGRLGERLYYFHPGEADPFLIRDSEVSYAFEAGKLSSVLSREGTELQAPADRDKAEIEGRLMARARELRRAADG